MALFVIPIKRQNEPKIEEGTEVRSLLIFHYPNWIFNPPHRSSGHLEMTFIRCVRSSLSAIDLNFRLPKNAGKKKFFFIPILRTSSWISL